MYAATAWFLAVSDAVAVAAITSIFGFLGTVVTAYLAYLNRREIRQTRREVRAPRHISTDREEGVRVEPPSYADIEGKEGDRKR
jgi:hypothetical protein